MSTADETDENAPVRASGATDAVEEAFEAGREMADEHLSNEKVSPDLRGDDGQRQRAPRWERMRFNYFDPVERQTLDEAQYEIYQIVLNKFPDAFRIIDEIQSICRVQRVDSDGEKMYDDEGDPVWERTANGRIVEDYTRLSLKAIEGYLMEITVHLLGWEQLAAQLHLEAMSARGRFEDAYAIHYDSLRGSSSRTTVDDRKAYGQIEASQDRHYAIYANAASRRADALVGSMVRLSQRLTDILRSAT